MNLWKNYHLWFAVLSANGKYVRANMQPWLIHVKLGLQQISKPQADAQHILWQAAFTICWKLGVIVPQFACKASEQNSLLQQIKQQALEISAESMSGKPAVATGHIITIYKHLWKHSIIRNRKKLRKLFQNCFAYEN